MGRAEDRAEVGVKVGAFGGGSADVKNQSWTGIAVAVLVALIGVGLRFIPHPPNLVPVLALIIFCGVVLPNRGLGLFLSLLVVGISDYFIGFYHGIEFVYAAYVLTAFMSLMISREKPVWGVLNAGMGSTLLFFVLSNFGVWFSSGLYPKTAAGLAECFVMALPFYGNTLMGTVGGLALLFGIQYFIGRAVATWLSPRLSAIES